MCCKEKETSVDTVAIPMYRNRNYTYASQQGCITSSRLVNIEFLNGTCFSFLAIDKITAFKDDKLVLIA